MEDDLRKALQEKQVDFTETEDFEGAIRQADAIYMTRIQDEYGQEEGCADSPFSLRKEHLDVIHSNCFIMHPFPRREELDRAIDGDPRATYWRQERNGMWTRAALISMIFGVEDRILLPGL